jgi:alkanesulfonate monooxygenase SsuD/methylene tetrahydromethanopterin reductase-like flavin-dependent oxidoreductase (luciferase family)
MENHSTPLNRRWTVCRVRIEAMKVIWSEEEPEYHGKFVNLDPIWSHPKPVQKSHPPVIQGTLSDKGLKRMVNYCDGWIPVGGTVQDMPVAIQQRHNLANEAGRPKEESPVSILGGSDDEKALGQPKELGVDRTVFFVPSADTDKVLPLLDKYSGYISQLAQIL